MLECVSEISANSIVTVMGMHEMEGRRWVVEVAPGLWTHGIPSNVVNTTQETLSMKGFTAGLALKREFSPHWGVGFLGAVARQSGASTFKGQSGLAPPEASPGVPGGAGFAGGQDKDAYADVAALMFTYDPFTDNEGFRMPISFGPMYVSQGLTFEHRFTNPNNGRAQTEKMLVKDSFWGPVGDVSLDFLLFKKLRVMPGLFFGGRVPKKGIDTEDWTTKDPNPIYDYTVDQNGTRYRFPRKVPGSNSVGSMHLGVLYRPWNLTFLMYFESGKTYALKWTRKFGA